MTKLLALLVAALSGSGTEACPHSPVGEWKSDRAASIEFARAHSKLAPQTDDFLSALFGHVTLTFTTTELRIRMPSVEVPVLGKSEPFAGFDERNPYTIVFCKAYSLVLSAQQTFDSEMSATTYNFVDPETFWVYAGSADPTAPDLHVREFFSRVR